MLQFLNQSMGDFFKDYRTIYLLIQRISPRNSFLLVFVASKFLS